MAAAAASRREVITVLGPIAPEAMGITQAHEHLLLDAMDHYGGYQYGIDDEERKKDESLPAWFTQGFKHVLVMRRWGICEEAGIQESLSTNCITTRVLSKAA